jgi:hypothetical protein
MALNTEQALVDYLMTELLLCDRDRMMFGSSGSLPESGNLESVRIWLQLVAFCEGEFGVEIPDTDVISENFETIRSLARLVEKLRERLLK